MLYLSKFFIYFFWWSFCRISRVCSVECSCFKSSLYIHPPHNITRSHINHRCLCKVVVYKELKCKIITINIIHIINNLWIAASTTKLITPLTDPRSGVEHGGVDSQEGLRRWCIPIGMLQQLKPLVSSDGSQLLRQSVSVLFRELSQFFCTERTF